MDPHPKLVVDQISRIIDTLNYGILPQDFANIEMQFGFLLPQIIRESYLMVDSQELESLAGCSKDLFFGLH
jgi:cell wall assembly regulator SMI1